MSHHMKMRRYLYICKDDKGNIFAKYGNSIFAMDTKYHDNWIYTPLGYRSNVSNDALVPKNFKVMWQYKAA